jgi:hypothetical protein
MCLSLLAAAPILLVSMEMMRLVKWLGRREMAGPNNASPSNRPDDVTAPATNHSASEI